MQSNFSSPRKPSKFTQPTVPRNRELILNITAPLLILLAPVLNFLFYHSYRLSTPESLLLIGSISIAASILGLLTHLAGSNVRTAFITICLCLYAYLQIGVPRLELFIGLLVIIGVVAHILRQHLAIIVCAMFGTIIITGFLGTGVQTFIVQKSDSISPPDMSLPPVLHLVLDEYIGLSGFPNEITGTKTLRSELESFYVDHQFRIFTNAFSRYYDTHNAIPNLLNRTTVSKDRHFVKNKERVLRENSYFKEMSNRGYQIQVYQPDYFNFCKTPETNVTQCLTYYVNSPFYFQDLPLSTEEKTQLLINSFLQSHHRSIKPRWVRGVRYVYQDIWGKLNGVGLPFPEWKYNRWRIGPIPSMSIFDRLSEDLIAAPRGKLFFAHLLIPHYPYTFNERCEIYPGLDQWLDRRLEHKVLSGESAENNTNSRSERYVQYFKQVRCLQSKLSTLFDRLESEGTFKDFTVVIHGDHGSRIVSYPPTEANLDKLTNRDLIAAFSAHMAIKRPGILPGIDNTSVSIDWAVESVLGAEFPGATIPEVLIRTGDKGDMKPIKLPEW